jgi:hypothetical protein
MGEQKIKKMEAEYAALKTLQFCRKHKKNYREWGYPAAFVGLVEELESVYPKRTPPGWELQQNKIDHDLLGDPALVDRVLKYYRRNKNV